MTYGKITAGMRAATVPKRRATPSSNRDMPRYMGFLLIENGKAVTRADDR
jgi:hypothetical protein